MSNLLIRNFVKLSTVTKTPLVRTAISGPPRINMSFQEKMVIFAGMVAVAGGPTLYLLANFKHYRGAVKKEEA